MMKNKRLLALLLALVLTLSTLPTAWAAETADPTATDPAVETSEAATDPTQESTEATAETTAPTEGSDDRNEAVRTDPEVSHVGRTGKVENGDMLYTKPDVTSESYKVWGIFGLVPYAVKVEEHFVVGDTEWYRFSNDGILNETTRGKYSYVKAENVTLDEETAETTEPTEETTEPSEPVEDDSGYESAVETFTGSTENISVAVMADEDVFPDGTVMSVFETTVDESAVIEAVEELAVLLSVVFVVVTAAGVTIAFLADGTNGVKNTFTPSQVTVEVNETFDGTKKEDVSIRNTGNTAAYIRAAVVVTWQDASGNVYGIEPVEGTDYKLELADDGWFKGADGYYYHCAPVGAGANTGILIDAATAVEDNAPAAGYFLSVEIIASGIQSVPTSVVQDNWDVTLDGNGIITGLKAAG